MDIKKIDQTEWLAVATKNIQGGLQGNIYSVINTPVVLVYRKQQVDEALCMKLGYDIYESYYNGGTLVANPGDVVFANFGYVKNSVAKDFIAQFVDWLKNKNLDAVYDNNDILVDGYKVCATCITRYGRIDYTTFFISMNPNLEHIKQICKKPMKKIPKGLSEYGITTEEVVEWLCGFAEEDDLDS